ncbi:hypothetical protein [Streptomyces sp. NPDC004065]|uniref:hypothetical protein n=1 Tax=Streptomyces sp. NPDC004065 TaxID=3364689 RepID=UPI00384D5CFF
MEGKPCEQPPSEPDRETETAKEEAPEPSQKTETTKGGTPERSRETATVKEEPEPSQETETARWKKGPSWAVASFAINLLRFLHDWWNGK